MHPLIPFAVFLFVSFILCTISIVHKNKKEKTLSKLASYKALYYKGMPVQERKYLNSKVSQLQKY